MMIRRTVLVRRFKNSYAGPMPPAPGTYRMTVDHYLTARHPRVGESFPEYFAQTIDDREFVKTTEHDWVVEP